MICYNGYDYEILKSFIPEEDKKRLIVFESVYSDGNLICAIYLRSQRVVY